MVYPQKYKNCSTLVYNIYCGLQCHSTVVLQFTTKFNSLWFLKASSKFGSNFFYQVTTRRRWKSGRKFTTKNFVMLPNTKSCQFFRLKKIRQNRVIFSVKPLVPACSYANSNMSSRRNFRNPTQGSEVVNATRFAPLAPRPWASCTGPSVPKIPKKFHQIA
jgi:hypothetical protein